MKRYYTLILAAALALPLPVIAAVDLSAEIIKASSSPDYFLQRLNQGKDPNEIVNGCPLVIYVTMKLARKKTADEQKWYQLLEAIIENNKCKVDALDTSRYTALMYAAYYGHYDAVKLLLRKAQADFCNDDDKTPISLAQDGRASALTQTQKDMYSKIIALLMSACKK